MDEAHRRQIESIIGGMTCPKDFVCCEDDSKNLCKAKDVGMRGYLDCLDEEATGCVFSLTFGSGRLCKCPLRAYLGKNLGI